MSTVRFLSRLSFICNICFLATLVMHYVPSLKNSASASTVIILGSVVSVIVNCTGFALYLIFVFARKNTGVPLWLLLANGVCFLLQLILFLK